MKKKKLFLTLASLVGLTGIGTNTNFLERVTQKERIMGISEYVPNWRININLQERSGIYTDILFGRTVYTTNFIFEPFPMIKTARRKISEEKQNIINYEKVICDNFNYFQETQGKSWEFPECLAEDKQ